MKPRTWHLALSLVLVLALAATLTACGVRQEPDGGAKPAPVDSPETGSRLAAGLYDLADGTVQAVGTLEYTDLEGGFWKIVGGTASEGTEGDTVAVIANGDEFADTLEGLNGLTVLATGTRLEGASIRQAGPEIEITEIVELSDTGGPAD